MKIYSRLDNPWEAKDPYNPEDLQQGLKNYSEKNRKRLPIWGVHCVHVPFSWQYILENLATNQLEKATKYQLFGRIGQWAVVQAFIHAQPVLGNIVENFDKGIAQSGSYFYL